MERELDSEAALVNGRESSGKGAGGVSDATAPDDLRADQVFRLLRDEIATQLMRLSTDSDFVQSLKLGIARFDTEGRLITMSDAAREILRIDPSDGLTAVEERIGFIFDVVEAIREGKEALIKDYELDDGLIVRTINAFDRHEDGRPNGIITMVVDMSTYADLVNQFARLQTRGEEFFLGALDKQRRSALILKTVLEASSTLVLEDVLASASRSIADAVGQAFCGIYLIDEERGCLAMHGRTGRLEDQGLLNDIVSAPLDLDEPLAIAIKASEQPLLILDAQNSELINDTHKNVLGLKSLLAIPLMAGGRLLGAAMVPSFDRPVEYDPERVEIANGIAKAVGLAIDNARLFEKSQELAVAEERNRLAHEIHDGLAQHLTGVVLQLEAASMLVESSPDEAAKRIDRARELARESLEEARRSVWALHPKSLEKLSVVEAVKAEVESIKLDTQLDGYFRTTGTRRVLSKPVESALLRLAQEALANAKRHAQASRVDVHLAFSETETKLVISDDGVGFEPSVIEEDESGYGLAGMKERAEAIGGSCVISSEIGKGTRVEFRIPIEG